MSAVRELLARCRSLFEADPADRLNEEIEAHASLLTEEYVARGMSPAAARALALRELGNLTSLRQQYREQGGLPLLENVWLDLKYSLRMLRRNPTFAASSIATLGVGLGAMIAVLCVVSSMLWRPLPYPDPQRLVVVHEVDPRGGQWPFAEPTLLDVQERSSLFSSVGALRTATVALTGEGGEPEMIQSAAITASLFQILGIVPVAGATFHGAEPDVFVSRRLWERRWHDDPRVVGSSLILNGEHYTVAGVGDPPVDLLPGVDLLFPLVPKASESRSAHDIEMVARIRAGIAVGQAQAELNVIAEGIGREHAQTNRGWGLHATPLASYLVGPSTSRMVWMIFGAVALLWLLACSNVAGLQLARGVTRRQEMGTRLSLGASRGRLMTQALVESLVLSMAGCLLGVILAQFGVAAIRSTASSFLPRLAALQMDAAAVFIGIGCMLVCTIFFGLSSSRVAAYQGARGISTRDYGRDALIVFQVALTSVLLLCATLLFQSFVRLETVNPGFDPEKILTVRLSHQAHPVAFFRSAIERLTGLRGVEAVAATNVPPFSGWGTANRFRLEGETTTSGFRSAAWRAVTPGFFATLGIPLKSGRLFSDADIDGSLEVVIVSESMARQYWPNQNPVGQRLLWGKSGNPKTIVGVVGDLRDIAAGSPPEPTMFRPFEQLSDAPMTLMLRTERAPTEAIADVRRMVWDVDRNAALAFQPLREAMSDSTLGARASLTAVATFAGISLIIAAFGLYGLIGYRVNQRKHEIGIRLALGATGHSIRWQVQERCLLLVCVGAGLGLPVAFALSRLIASQLYETETTQAGAYLLVVLVFAAVALAASFGPAHRAARLDPAAVIRHESN